MRAMPDILLLDRSMPKILVPGVNEQFARLKTWSG